MNIKGLTLIELLVVISIMVIVTGTIVINNNKSQDNVNLFGEKSFIVQNIYKAKEMALSGVGATTGKAYGIGVWFNDPNGEYYYIYRNNESTAVPDRGYDSGDIILEKIFLEDGIKYELKGVHQGLLFIPPTPYVAICQNNVCMGTLFELYVYKEVDQGNLSEYKTIKVNTSGLIE